MPRRGQRTVIARGIYQDASGIAIVIRLDGKQKEFRFPLDTPRHILRERRLALEQDQQRRREAGRTSLEQSAKDYLAQKAGALTESTLTAAGSELRAWIAALGAHTGRHQITEGDVLRVRRAWQQAGIAPKTINNRLDRLRQLYRALDGKRAWTPVDDIDPLKVSRTPIQRIAPSVINGVLARLTDPPTRARFMVYASTGRRPSEIGRTEPSDVNLEARVWVPRDGKGGFTPGLYLNDEMRMAWQAMIDADAFGPFNVNSFTRRLHAAGWPTSIRPYQLRHNVGIALSESGHDLDDIGPQLGHKRRETTRRHYVPVLGSRMQRMAESLEGRFGWAKTPKKKGKKTPA